MPFRVYHVVVVINLLYVTLYFQNVYYHFIMYFSELGISFPELGYVLLWLCIVRITFAHLAR